MNSITLYKVGYHFKSLLTIRFKKFSKNSQTDQLILMAEVIKEIIQDSDSLLSHYGKYLQLK